MGKSQSVSFLGEKFSQIKNLKHILCWTNKTISTLGMLVENLSDKAQKLIFLKKFCPFVPWRKAHNGRCQPLFPNEKKTAAFSVLSELTSPNFSSKNKRSSHCC